MPSRLSSRTYRLVGLLLGPTTATASASTNVSTTVLQFRFLPARRYASAGNSYDPVSVCVCHMSVFYQKGRTG